MGRTIALRRLLVIYVHRTSEETEMHLLTPEEQIQLLEVSRQFT